MDKERLQYERFERLDMEVRKLITSYQCGMINLGELVANIAPLHAEIGKILVDLEYFEKRFADLERAYHNIKNGDDRYIATLEDSYHNILFRIHHEWAAKIAERGIKTGSYYLVGWDSYASVPAELKEFVESTSVLNKLPPLLKFHTEMGGLIVKSASGWTVYMNIGSEQLHYSTVRRDGNETIVELSDCFRDRLEAVKKVLESELGFRAENIKSISWLRGDYKEWTEHATKLLKNANIDRQTIDKWIHMRGRNDNYLCTLRKTGTTDMRKLACTFYWGAWDCGFVFWDYIPTGLSEGESFPYIGFPPEEGSDNYKKSVYLQQKIITWYLTTPMNKWVPWPLLFGLEDGRDKISAFLKRIEWQEFERVVSQLFLIAETSDVDAIHKKILLLVGCY